MKRHRILRIAQTLVLVTILISPEFLGQLAEVEGQNRIGSEEYDYYSLALASVLNSAREASKLPDIPQRINLMLKAVKLLPLSQRAERLQLLEVALRDLKEWGSVEKASWSQHQTAAELRTQVLAVYATVDQERTMSLHKELQAEAKSSSANNTNRSLKSRNWFSKFSENSALSDQSAKIALSLVDSDPEKALGLIVQSVQFGTVSDVLLEIVHKLIQNGNRPLLDKVETAIGGSLAGNVTLDPYGVSFAALLVLTDKDMSSVTKSAFVGFLMRSLETWAIVVKEPGIDPAYITRTFYAFSQTVRPAISQYSPSQLIVFDLVLDQVLPLVPEKMKSVVKADEPETFSDPRDRLADIMRDPAPAKRDLRLIGLVSELLGKQSGDVEKNLELASDAISGFTDPEAKTTYTDRLAITRIDLFVKQKKFIEAQQLAGSISSEETRAWALLALSSVAAKSDPVLGFELISNAQKALDKASPSPHKVELALTATAMLAKTDPQRAFETFSTAARYANSSPSKVEVKRAFAFGLDAKIGEAHIKLGVSPENLGELKNDPALSALATTDWFRAIQVASDIREPALRLQLKLQFAGSMLAQESKRRREKARKPS